MAPVTLDTSEKEAIQRISKNEQNGTANGLHERQPLNSTGVLDQYEMVEVTPVIGREYPTANLVDWLQAPNADEVLTELALTSKTLRSIARHFIRG